MTLDEIAKELGVSTSTVSRALSGKGRIGEKTRSRIVSFVEEQEQKEGRNQKKQQRTHNLGVVFHDDVYTSGSFYFHDCLLGICEAAALRGYNVVVTVEKTNDIVNLRSIVEEQKVDGIILTRALDEDKALRYLVEQQFPTGMTGTCNRQEVIQVDTDNERLTEELVSILVGQGFERFALVVEDLSFNVNRSRRNGFYKALIKNGIPEREQLYYTGALKIDFLDTIISDMIAKKVQCIICGDDVISTWMMSRLQAGGYRVPKDIAIASLYNSSNLNCFSPSITAVSVPARQVGIRMGTQMIHCLEGEKYAQKSMMDYEILLRKSTKSKEI